MRLIFPFLLLALLGCANKPALVQVAQSDKCGELFSEVAPFMLEIVKNSIKMPVSGIVHDMDNDTYYDNVCHETIICDNVEYCISFIKPDGSTISAFATEAAGP